MLVVHGIGSQRARETVRGVVDAAWLQDANDPGSADPPRQVWTHPEYSGVDIDLSVTTTSGLSVSTPGGYQRRSIDFHELYWAHLMSETRAVAVLLWLFDLVRKGPRLKPGMGALWWVSTVFLCTVLASLVLIVLHLISRMASLDGYNHVLALAPLFALFVLSASALIAALVSTAWRLFVFLLLATIAPLLAFWFGIEFESATRLYATLYLAPVLSVLVAWVAMGSWGALVMALTFAVASASVPFYTWVRADANPLAEWGAWSLAESWSAVVACVMIILYFAFNALFLQSFLGDAARYFRNAPGNVAVRREIRKQAVDTLDALHASGKYDRIIVVAHSLGTVVAYDMLRAYFSRVCKNLPDPAALGPEIDAIDGLIVKPDHAHEQKLLLRNGAREIIRSIATVRPTPGAPARTTKWLVTDFVTLGSALTHAHYLMCNGDTHAELLKDFDRRVGEREYPTCPPVRRDDDGLLLFGNPATKKRGFHHGALFGLTRWTNLYFPLRQLLWGDAIGGPLAPIFGPYIEDIEVSTYAPPRPAFFTHTAYWSLKWPGGRKAPQIQALQAAINLEDKTAV
ncbi:MAG: hypothetical protein V4517_05750 [Pseudomonadota bacterium]